MKRFVISAAATLAALSMAPVAQAATYAVGSPQFTATSGPNGQVFGSFSINGVGVGVGTPASPVAFSDSFTFTLPANGFGSGSVTSIATALLNATDLDFTSVTINGVAAPITGAGTLVETAARTNVGIVAGVLNTIVVSGVSRGSGSYSGVLSFAPTVGAVPEPATWGMMLVGFGLAGAGLRSRRRKTNVSFA